MKLWKRITAGATSAALLLVAAGTPLLQNALNTAPGVVLAVDETETTADGLQYQNPNGYVHITGYTGKATDLVIPEEIDGCPVVQIDYGAFEELNTLTSVSIPDTVTTIAGNAFKGCTGLTSVSIPDSVFFLGEYAFYFCSSLQSVTLSPKTAAIFHNTFACCEALTSVDIPEGVASIGDGAFATCTALAAVTIPDSVKTIGSDVFADTAICNSFASGIVYVDDWVVDYYGLEEESDKDVVLPESTRGISGNAFCGFNDMGSIIIPDGVVFIGKDAFASQNNLTAVTIGTGVEEIGAFAFSLCTSLQEVTIPGSVRRVGTSAFEECYGLCAVTIEAGVQSIEGSAFALCTSLQTVTLPDSVIRLGDSAFAECSALTTAVLSRGMKTIDTLTFTECTSLTHVTIPKSITSICSLAFGGCIALTHVSYRGTEAQWSAVEVDEDNSCLLAATFDFQPEVIASGEPVFIQNDDNTATLTQLITDDETVLIPLFTDGAVVTEIAGDALADCPNLTTIYGYVGTAAEEYATNNGITFRALGDLDCNRKINSVDAVLVLKLVASSLLGDEITGENKLLSDVDANDKINSNDAVLILRYYATSLTGDADWVTLLQ